MSNAKNLRIEIGNRIRSIRTSRGLTGKALATQSGISPAYLSEVERGLSNISSEKLSRISSILDVSIQELMSSDSNSNSNNQNGSISIPIALSEAADELDLSFSTVLSLYQGASSLIARRSSMQNNSWSKEEWINFYNKVKGFLD